MTDHVTHRCGVEVEGRNVLRRGNSRVPPHVVLVKSAAIHRKGRAAAGVRPPPLSFLGQAAPRACFDARMSLEVCVCRSVAVASALVRCIIKVGQAETSRAAPKEGSSQKWSIKHLNNNNNNKKSRVAPDGDQELPGCVSADCAHGGSVRLRGSEASHTRSADVVHLDPERVTLCRGVYVCDSGVGVGWGMPPRSG